MATQEFSSVREIVSYDFRSPLDLGYYVLSFMRKQETVDAQIAALEEVIRTNNAVQTFEAADSTGIMSEERMQAIGARVFPYIGRLGARLQKENLSSHDLAQILFADLTGFSEEEQYVVLGWILDRITPYVALDESKLECVLEAPEQLVNSSELVFARAQVNSFMQRGGNTSNLAALVLHILDGMHNETMKILFLMEFQTIVRQCPQVSSDGEKGDGAKPEYGITPSNN